MTASHATARRSSTHQSIERAVAIMREFSEHEPALGVAEISRRVDLHKSTVSRILTTLTNEGLVTQDPSTGRYSLGVGLLTMAGVALGQIDARAAAFAHMEELASITAETVAIAVRRGDRAVSVGEVPSRQSVRYVTWVGRHFPLNCTASGKVLLAGMADDELASHLRHLVACTESSITSSGALELEVRAAAYHGFAIERDEFESGISTIAAPVLDHDAEVVAALSVGGPSFRLGGTVLDEFVQPLQLAAEATSNELGFAGEYPVSSVRDHV